MHILKSTGMISSEKGYGNKLGQEKSNNVHYRKPTEDSVQDDHR